MATLIVYKDADDTAERFRTGGMDFDLAVMFDTLNQSLFDGELKRLEPGRVFIPNPKTAFGLEIVATMFAEDTLAVTTGKQIIIHPFITMHSFPLDATTITRVLLHEMVHVLGFQRYGRLDDHESCFFGSTVAQINEKLGMPETERDKLKHWPQYPIPVFDLLARRLRIAMHHQDYLMQLKRSEGWPPPTLPDMSRDITAPLGDHFIEVAV